VSVPESVTTELEDTGNSRSGVFRRIMARDVYDVTKRVADLEEGAKDPISAFLTSWPQVVLLVVMLILLLGSFLYYGQRIERIERLHSDESASWFSELESKQRMIDELRETLRQQASSMRTMSASSALTAKEPEAAETAKDEEAVPRSASSSKPREPLPASLEPGEVLLIVASTLIKEEAIDQALALEPDGFASEVILGKTGYYGVALGRFDLQQAKSMKSFLVDSGIVSTTPYLIGNESIDSWVYP